jgi:hypothetical protein
VVYVCRYAAGERAKERGDSPWTSGAARRETRGLNSFSHPLALTPASRIRQTTSQSSSPMRPPMPVLAPSAPTPPMPMPVALTTVVLWPPPALLALPLRTPALAPTRPWPAPPALFEWNEGASAMSGGGRHTHGYRDGHRQRWEGRHAGQPCIHTTAYVHACMPPRHACMRACLHACGAPAPPGPRPPSPS